MLRRDVTTMKTCFKYRYRRSAHGQNEYTGTFINHLSQEKNIYIGQTAKTVQNWNLEELELPSEATNGNLAHKREQGAGL